ncbi:Tetratricopeptide repeat (TPR)-like superfamily protein [Euphorbia peplus]|nr:Tetratricopeptide repeat (TPR)-like superfamily protein [Euphorbia peplus]
MLMVMGQVNDVLHPSQRPLCVSQLALANYACGRLPVTPRMEDSSPKIVTSDLHRHERNRHRHRQANHDSPAENCCRWLNDLDDECVCDLLIRLPAFLASPEHQYTVAIGNACKVSYQCNGRGRP